MAITSLTQEIKLLLDETAQAKVPGQNTRFNLAVYAAFDVWVRNAINNILKNHPSDDQALPAALEEFLGQCFGNFQGTAVSLTSYHGPTNQLLVRLAVLIYQNQEQGPPPLALLMPGVSLEPIDPTRYPDLGQITDADRISRVLQTHIFSPNRGLIPARLLLDVDPDSLLPWAPYFSPDIFPDATDAERKEHVPITPAELEELYDHSLETRGLKECKLGLARDSNNLYFQLNRLLANLYRDSVHEQGTEEEAGSGIFDTLRHFRGFWLEIIKHPGSKIPEDVSKVVDEFLSIATNWRRNARAHPHDLCVATQRTNLKRVIECHADALSALSLTQGKAKEYHLAAVAAVQEAKKRLSASIEDGHYQGHEYRPPCLILTSILDIAVKPCNFADGMDYLSGLGPETIRWWLEDEKNGANFLDLLDPQKSGTEVAFRRLCEMVYKLSPHRLKAVFILNRGRSILSDIVKEAPEPFLDLLEQLCEVDPERLNIVLNPVNVACVARGYRLIHRACRRRKPTVFGAMLAHSNPVNRTALASEVSGSRGHTFFHHIYNNPAFFEFWAEVCRHLTPDQICDGITHPDSEPYDFHLLRLPENPTINDFKRRKKGKSILERALVEYGRSEHVAQILAPLTYKQLAILCSHKTIGGMLFHNPCAFSCIIGRTPDENMYPQLPQIWPHIRRRLSHLARYKLSQSADSPLLRALLKLDLSQRSVSGWLTFFYEQAASKAEGTTVDIQALLDKRYPPMALQAILDAKQQSGKAALNACRPSP